MSFTRAPQPGWLIRSCGIVWLGSGLVSNAQSPTNASSFNDVAGAGDVPSAQTIPLAFHENVWFWLAIGFGVLLVAFLIWKFRRHRSSRFRVLPSFSAGSDTAVSQTAYVNQGPENGASPDPRYAPATETISSDTSFWQQRVRDAEQRAERASALVRAGLTPHLARLMKDQLVWTLMAQRSQMVCTQDAEAEMVAELAQRLGQIQAEFESRVETYEKRIAELERELASKSQVNRELLGAKIEIAKKALLDVAVRRPDSPFAAKYLLQKRIEEGGAKSRAGENTDHDKFPFSDIMARRASDTRR